MKKIISLACILACILIIGTVAYNGFIQQSNQVNAQKDTGITGQNGDVGVSIDKAKDNVRSFSGESNAPVKFVCNLTAPHGKYYEMATPGATYMVNAKTGEVQAVTYRNPLSVTDGSIPVTKDQAESTAKAFVNKHDAGFFANENIGLVQADFADHGSAGSEYMFVWGQCINGILTPITTMVRIDSATGNVNAYARVKMPVMVDLVAKVTKDQAENIAVGQFKDGAVDKTDAFLKVVYKSDGSQAVAWVVHIIGQPVNGIEYVDETVIDANTGELINTNPVA